MDFKQLQEFIDNEDARIIAHYGYTDNEKRILARTVKLSEEMGELSEQVLLHAGLQRTEKLNSKDTSGLAGEFADVILVTMLLAKSMDVDVATALEQKIAKIKARHY